jgi:hypothetical protein
VLSDGSARRIYNFPSQTSGAVILIGASVRFVGDLWLECLPAGEEWRIDISDVPATVARSLRAA